MSIEKKKQVNEIKETFRKITQEADQAGRKAGTLGDKTLTEKIRKVQQDSGEIVKHIQERTEQ